MIKKMLFHIFCGFIITLSFVVSTEYRMASANFTEQERGNSEAIEVNVTDLPNEFMENNTISTAENDSLFWTDPSNAGTINNATAEVVIIETNNQLNQFEKVNEGSTEKVEENTPFTENDLIFESNETPTQAMPDQTTEQNKNSEAVIDVTGTSSHMSEKIKLRRNNCHLEIAVRDTSDLKIQIKFEPLQNNSAGKCCITLNSHEGSMLGVIISNIHLYRNGTEGEVIKVIVKDYGSAFVLKEYHGGSTYEPLLLTETYRVYIILHYSVTTVTGDGNYSHFDLEVFTYHKYNNYNQNLQFDNNYHSGVNYFFS